MLNRAPMETLFENAHVVAVDKPGGWLSVPSRLGAKDPRPCLGITLEQEKGLRLWPVHRLDEEVTGVILFAKTAEAHRTMSKWFEDRQVSKQYEALTELGGVAKGGQLRFDEQTFETKILRGKKRAYESPHGKPAITKALVVHTKHMVDGEAIFWELKPVTGRPHQLRFELGRRGFPILGDKLYGSTRPFLSGREDTIALRCVSLDFSKAPGADALELPAILAAKGLTDFMAKEASK